MQHNQNPMMRRGPAQSAQEERFRVLNDPKSRNLYYREVADTYGMKNPQGQGIGASLELSPLIQTVTTTISTATAQDPNVPVSLNANVPQQQGLRFYFTDGAFINRVSYRVLGLRLLTAGQPEPGFFDGQTDPGNYIYGQFKRAGAGQVFMDNPVALSSVMGDGKSPYFWDLIPVVQPGGTLLLDLSILPPGWTDSQNPPFVRSVAEVQVSLHCERIVNWGY